MNNSIPERPQLHKTKNRGYVRTTCEQTGKRKTKYFKGEYGSVIMWDDFNAWRRRQMGQAVPARPTLDQAARSPAVATASTIYQLCSMFLSQCLQDRRHGRPDQSEADRAEITHTKLALRLLTPYGDMAIDDFKTAHLAMARETEIAMGNSCKTINGKIQKIVRMFRHGCSDEICSGETWKKLEAWYKDKKLTPKKHKHIPGARKVHAAPLPDVLAVVAAAPPTIACMITIQSTTGMRSANVCGMAWEHIDQSLYETEGIWKYTPTRHKTSDAGHTLAVFLGPQAIQAILDYENLRPDKGHPFLFNPKVGRCFRYWQEHIESGGEHSWYKKNNGSKVTLQQYYNQSTKPHRLTYSSKSYCDAVQRVQRKIGVDRWTPHQLRHLHNERLVESNFGDSGAAAVLGHQTLQMTRNYSKSQDERLAAQVQAMLG